MKPGIPIGSALPPRRDSLVEAAATPLSNSLDAIVAPKARDRLLELIEREQLPSDVRTTLNGALSGDLRAQQLLFQAMIDTWPRLQKNLTEVFREVKKAPWQFDPFSVRGAEAGYSAVEKAELAEDAFWSMSPRIARGEKGGKGIIEQLAYGYFAGHQVLEIRWEEREGNIAPRAGKVIPPRFYGYPYDDRDEDQEDRLMFNRDGGFSGYEYEDFPEHKFLLAINGGHPGHPTVAAPLRALAQYWLAAVYGLKWLMDFSQKFGIPFRWATFADPNSKSEVAQMMQQIGSGGWGVFPTGTELNVHDATKAASAVPQKELIELADRQCDTFILGQTLTTDVGDSGSRALGDVHQDVRMDVMQGVVDFVADILNEQFLPSLIELNYGEAKEVPTICAKFEKPRDEEAMARRDKELFVSLGLPVETSWLYERHGVPIPDPDSDDLFQPKSHGVQGDPATGGQQPPEEPSHETKARLEASDNRTQSAISTIDQLSANVLEDLTGVTKEWLSPVRPFFERLAALAMSKTVSDEDFAEALEKAQRELPELFDRFNTEVLQESLERAIGSAMIAGSVRRYEEDDDA